MLPLRTRVDQGAIAIKGYSAFWNLTISLFSVICRTLVGDLNSLQGCSRCILQLLPTRQQCYLVWKRITNTLKRASSFSDLSASRTRLLRCSSTGAGRWHHYGESIARLKTCINTGSSDKIIQIRHSIDKDLPSITEDIFFTARPTATNNDVISSA